METIVPQTREKHWVLNVVLALIWTLLQEKLRVSEFIIGFVVAYAVIFMFKRVLAHEMQDTQVRGFKQAFVLSLKIFRYLLVFMKEVVVANIDVVKIVLSPKLNIKPGIIAYKMDVKTDAGITLLANSITLTPGTLTVDVSEDRQTLYIHALHIQDAEAVEASIRGSLEKYTKEILE